MRESQIKKLSITIKIFYKKGEVDIIIEGEEEDKQRIYQKPKVISTLGKGKSFGIVGFFTGFSESYTVRSKEFCKLLYIKRQDFLELLKEFSNDYEKFCYIKDNIMLYNDLNLIKKKCLSCQNTQHLLQECPDIHYTPNKDRIIARFVSKTYKQRFQYDRKSHSYKVKGVKLDCDQVSCFQNENKELIEDFYVQTFLSYQIKNEMSCQNLEDAAVQKNQNELNVISVSQPNLTNNNHTVKEIELSVQSNRVYQEESKQYFQDNLSNIEMTETNQKFFKSKINMNLENQKENQPSEDLEEKLESSFHQVRNILPKIDSSQVLSSLQKMQDQAQKKAKVNPQKNRSIRQSQSKAISQMFTSQNKIENLTVNQANQLEDQLHLIKETLLNNFLQNHNIEEQFEVFRNFEYYFPLNNLNFILQTQNLEKQEKKWYFNKYNKIYQDIYKQSQSGKSKFRKKNTYSLALPHSLSPQIINSAVRLNKKSTQIFDFNSLPKSLRLIQSGCEKQSASLTQKICQNSTPMITNQYQPKQIQLSNDQSNSDTLQKSQHLNSQTNLYQNNDQNQEKISNFRSYRTLINSSRLNNFDDYEIQVEYEENISQTQQLNVVFPQRKKEL